MSGSNLMRMQDVPKTHLLIALAVIGAAYAQVIAGMVSDWYVDENYSHGFLVPLVSLYFFLQNREALQQTVAVTSRVGLLAVAGSLLLLVFGHAGTEYFSMRISLVFLLGGIVLYWYGWKVLRVLSLPLGFLVFMVPLPYIVYDAMAFPLKLVVAKYSVFSLKMFGLSVVREGNIIMFPQTVLEVADACSGLRSLMSLITLSVALAFITLKSPVTRTVLILSAVPVAIVTNMFRVIATGILAHFYGAEAAQGFFHEFAGMAVFALAMIILFSEGAILRRIER